ncbi:hypothetical protein HJ199_14325 [Vibrio parahaemolyticus]|nr:hypothetical protein [Vibrio parahaemolyticus]
MPEKLNNTLSSYWPSVTSPLAEPLNFTPKTLLIIIVVAWFILLVASYYFHAMRNKSFDKVASFALEKTANLTFALASVVWASSVSIYGAKIQCQLFENKCAIGYESVVFVLSVALASLLGVVMFLGRQRQHEINQCSAPLDAVEELSTFAVMLYQNYGLLLSRVKLSVDRCRSYDKKLRKHKKKKKKKKNEKRFESIKKELEKERVDLSTDLKNLESEIVKGIQHCMSNMLNVVKAWTGTYDIHYRCNLFNVIDSENLQKELKNKTVRINNQGLQKSPFFLFNENEASRLSHSDKILINEQHMTCSLGITQAAKPHDPIYMPFSFMRKDGDKPFQPNFFGAPKAIEHGTTVFTANIQHSLSSFISDLRRNEIYSKYVDKDFVNKIRSYYQKDSAGSILSIPLYDDVYIYKCNCDDSDMTKCKCHMEECKKIEILKECTNVLNIYSTKPYLFASEKVASSYCALTEPTWQTLSNLISLRLEVIRLLEQLNGPPEDRYLPTRTKVVKIQRAREAV